MNEKQKEIVIQEVCDRLCIEKGEEHPSYNDGIFFTTRFAENLLAAQTVSFPEPSEDFKKDKWEIDVQFLLRIQNDKQFALTGVELVDIESVLLAYQKLKNEGKV